MPRASPLVFAAALSALVACATEQPATQSTATASPQASAAPGQKAVPKKICENEMPIGSHIATVRCRNVDDSSQQRAATQADLLRPQTNLGAKAGGGN
ncbi:MAG TPA: hypothetical protein VMU15_11700 [Anaeromyxobacter sp.]|nr:hypothetical protein [Anaeromyxobacter sp.]